METKEKDEKEHNDGMIPFSMKIDKETFNEIKERARVELRSINKQITYLLICGLKHLKEIEGDKG